MKTRDYGDFQIGWAAEVLGDAVHEDVEVRHADGWTLRKPRAFPLAEVGGASQAELDRRAEDRAIATANTLASAERRALPPPTRRAAERLISEHGLNPAEFDMHIVEGPFNHSKDGARKSLVSRRGCATIKLYDCDVGEDWLLDFKVDLKAGRFG